MKNAPYIKAKYELRPSKIIPGQVGLFSLRDFKTGEVVIPTSNWDESRLITWDEFNNLDEGTKRQLIFFCYHTPEGIYAPQDINKLNIGYFMNHSCDPIIVYDPITFDYVAKKDIHPGDEFTLDIQSLMTKGIFSFECKCGSKNCRKIITI